MKDVRIDDVLEAARVLSHVSECCAELLEPSAEAVAAQDALTLAASYLVELAAHMQNGMDSEKALVAMAKGELEL